MLVPTENGSFYKNCPFHQLILQYTIKNSILFFKSILYFFFFVSFLVDDLVLDDLDDFTGVSSLVDSDFFICCLNISRSMTGKVISRTLNSSTVTMMVVGFLPVSS